MLIVPSRAHTAKPIGRRAGRPTRIIATRLTTDATHASGQPFTTGAAVLPVAGHVDAADSLLLEERRIEQTRLERSRALGLPIDARSLHLAPALPAVLRVRLQVHTRAVAVAARIDLGYLGSHELAVGSSIADGLHDLALGDRKDHGATHFPAWSQGRDGRTSVRGSPGVAGVAREFQPARRANRKQRRGEGDRLREPIREGKIDSHGLVGAASEELTAMGEESYDAGRWRWCRIGAGLGVLRLGTRVDHDATIRASSTALTFDATLPALRIARVAVAVTGRRQIASAVGADGCIAERGPSDRALHVAFLRAREQEKQKVGTSHEACLPQRAIRSKRTSSVAHDPGARAPQSVDSSAMATCSAD